MQRLEWVEFSDVVNRTRTILDFYRNRGLLMLINHYLMHHCIRWAPGALNSSTDHAQCSAASLISFWVQ